MIEEDSLKLDSHKLIYHIPRVHQWLQGENIYPIYIEVGLYSGCNHRCIFCAFDFLGYKLDILETRYLKRFISDAAKKGVKAILYSGEGEPLLRKDASDIIIYTKKAGIDVALATNGTMLDKNTANKILPYLTWLKVSLDAGTEKGYAFIHGTERNNFQTVIHNLKTAVKIKKKYKYNCVIGVQYLLLPQNQKEITTAAKISCDIGADYFVVKPYSQHPSSQHQLNSTFQYRNLLPLEKRLKKYETDTFQIIFRRQAMEKITGEKCYQRCLGLPFITYITASGDVYPCNVFLERRELLFGNICEESFKDIWEGKRRKKIMKMLYEKWDVEKCRKSCRLDEINCYLWRLKNPDLHVNFI